MAASVCSKVRVKFVLSGKVVVLLLILMEKIEGFDKNVMLDESETFPIL